MSMMRIVVGTFAGVILAVVVLYAGFSYLQWRSSRAYFAPPPVPSPAASFQDKMLRQGYLRDHLTHRWYSIWVVTSTNGCAAYGPPLNTTFKCNTPLNPSSGIPDEK